MKLEIFEFQNETYEIQIGKNKLENDELVRKAKSTDIWFHIANAPSCHVVLIAHNEKSLPKQSNQKYKKKHISSSLKKSIVDGVSTERVTLQLLYSILHFSFFS